MIDNARVPVSRDRAVEDVVLDELVLEVARQTGEDISAFAGHVRARMDYGASVYGDDAFARPDRDNLQEHRDEMADGIAYPMFELHCLNARTEEAPERAHQLLFEAMVHAAISHVRARQARWLMAE